MSEPTGILERIIEAIDKGLPIDVDLQQISDADERSQAKALLDVAKVSAAIKNRQHHFQKDAMQSGDKWAHLIIKEKIGSGGFGQVYRAFDTVLEAEVAVKFLNPASRLEIDTEAFLQEARLMATVRNPHVLAIHGAATDKGVAGYWSDYLDGQVLHQRLQQAQLSHAGQLNIIDNLIQAVRATHENDVVHGDIKSLNVMLQPKRGAILLDFGSGRSGLEDISEEEALQVSPIAMAPEQFDGKGNSKAGDVFALGLLLVEVLTGKHPFVGKSMAEIKHMMGHLPEHLQTSGLDKSWRVLLSRMLAFETAQRPDISWVEHHFKKIQAKPLERAKKVTLTAVIALLAGITLMALYSNWNIRQANQQTEIINGILSSTFLTVDPYTEGQEVKLVDVLKQAGEQIFSHPDLSDKYKQDLSVQMLSTQHALSDDDYVLNLANQILAMPNLSRLNRMKVNFLQGRYYSQQDVLDQSSDFFQLVLAENAATDEEYDQQMSSLAMVITNHIARDAFAQLPALMAQLDELKNKGTGNAYVMGQLAFVSGRYLSRTFKRQASYEAYQEAASYFAQQYHENHQSVITTLGAAAVELAISGDPALQVQGLKEMHELLPKFDSVLGSKHVETLKYKGNLGLAQLLTGQPQRALDTFLSIRADSYQELGEFGLGILTNYEKYIAWAYQDTQQLDQAEAAFMSIIDKLEVHHPDAHHGRIRIDIDLINFFNETQQFAKAEALIDVSLSRAEKWFGAESRLALEIAGIRFDVAHAQENPDAVAGMQALYDQHVRLWGPEDHQTLSIKQRLEAMRDAALP
ncbi:serine/threonine-protein kinase [Marinicella sp. W31]|uniref:serine/threonine-protein kinase n=1 Tax=Marinicella sp. W31 TaxID=3023713 RepID=UPI003757A129